MRLRRRASVRPGARNAAVVRHHVRPKLEKTMPLTNLLVRHVQCNLLRRVARSERTRDCRPRTLKCQSPPQGRAVNILAMPRGTLDLTVQILTSPRFEPISCHGNACPRHRPVRPSAQGGSLIPSRTLPRTPVVPPADLTDPWLARVWRIFLDQRLSRSHVRILVALYEAAADGGATTTQLVERTGYSRAAVSTALSRARARGLVYRESLGPRQVLFRPLGSR